MTDPADIADNLPELERQVFAVLRGNGPLPVSDVVTRLEGEGRSLAYTTVMTVLTRLWQKGYLSRQQKRRSYLYGARSEEEIRSELGGRAARDALTKFGTPALTGFVRTLSADQRALVTKLLQDGDDSAAAATD